MTKQMLILAAICTAAILITTETLPAQDAPGGPPPGPMPQDSPPPLMGQQRHWQLRPVEPQEETELLEILEKHQPARHRQLMRLKQRDPQAYQRAIQKGWAWCQHWKTQPESIRQAHLRMAELRIGMMKLAIHLRRDLPDERKGELEDQLRGVIAEYLDTEQQVLEHHLEELEKRLTEMRAELARRAQDRTQLIEDRMERLIRLAGRFRHKNHAESSFDDDLSDDQPKE